MSQILSDFLSVTPAGLYCAAGDFYLDPLLPVAAAVISHAHGDHARPGNLKVFCTTATAAIMQLRYRAEAGNAFHCFTYHQFFDLGPVRLCFIPAGHILGSAQVLMEYKGIRYLYTGDYKIQADPTCPPVEFVPADVLITESTFADPAIQHPDPAGQIEQLNAIPHPVLLGTYALGKAQRINQLINQYCPGRRVLLHRSILSIHKIYEDFGVNFLRYEPYQRRLFRSENKGLVYLVPPLAFSSFDPRLSVVRAFASGWEKLHQGNGISLYISDHVDWADILFTIQQVRPREIWTLHGDGRHLYAHFKGALPVRILNQKDAH